MQVLAGSRSPTLRENGLDQTSSFGRCREVGMKKLKRQVQGAIEQGRVIRTKKGLLLPW